MRTNPNLKEILTSTGKAGIDVIDRIKNGKTLAVDDMMSPLDGSFVLSLAGGNKVRVIHSAPEILGSIRDALGDGWENVRGREEERSKVRTITDRDYSGSREFSLGGCPWKQGGSAFSKNNKIDSVLDSVDARRALLRCLAKLYSKGWVVEVSTNFSPKNNALSNLVFSTNYSQEIPKNNDQEILFDPMENIWKRWDFACISLHGSNIIRLCYDSAQTEATAILVTGTSQCRGDACAHPDEIVAAIASAIRDGWPKGLSEWSLVAQGVAVEFRLVGAPWKAFGNDTIDVRNFACLMLQNVRCDGWMPFTTLSCSPPSSGLENIILQRHRKNYGSKGRMTSTAPKEGWKLSKEPPKDPICCLSLHEPNILRIVGLQDHDDIQLLIDSLSGMWPIAGVGDVFQQNNSVQINLVGEPWSDSQNSFNAGYMIMARIIQTLAESCDFTLVNNCGALTLSKSMSSKSSFFFTKRKYEGICPDGSYPVTILTMHETGNMKLINLVNEDDVLLPSIGKALEFSWPGNVDGPSKDNEHAIYTFNLSGSPWHARGKRGLHLKSMLGHVLAAVRCSGWKVIASPDIYGDKDASSPRTSSSGANAWFLTKDIELFEQMDTENLDEERQGSDTKNLYTNVESNVEEFSSRITMSDDSDQTSFDDESFYSSDDSASIG